MSIHRLVGKRGNTYEVRLRSPDGREISRSFRTEREARAFEADQRATMHRGGWVDPRSATTLFRVIAERWQHANPTKRPSTRARDDVTLRLHLLPALGDKPIGQITPADVRTERRRSAPRRPLTGHVPVRFDATTIAAVRKRAQADGMTVSAWIRRLVARELAPMETTTTQDTDAVVVHIPAGTRRVALELDPPRSRRPRTRRSTAD